MITVIIFLFLIAIAWIWRIRGDDLIVFLYIVLFPLRSVIPPSEMLLGFISPDNIIAIIAVVYLPLKDGRIWRRKLDPQKKNSVMLFVVFDLFFMYYIVLKNQFVLITPVVPTIKTIINDAIFLILFIFLLKNLDKKRVYMTIEKGIIVSSILLGLSIFFADKLFIINLNPDIGKYYDFKEIASRPSGFYYNDPNVTGMFCVVYFFFILARVLFNQKRNAAYLVALFSLFLGIINTGSRTSFIALFCSLGLMLFSFRRHIKTASFFLIFIGIIGFLLFFYSKFGDPMSERFLKLNQQSRFSITSLSRFEYWKIYLKEIAKKPDFLVLGNLDPPPINRAPHNYYITMLYFGGVWIVLAYFALIRRIMKFKNPSSSTSAFPVSYTIIACSICLFTLSDPPPKNLALVIAMSSGLMVLKVKPQRIDAHLAGTENRHG